MVAKRLFMSLWALVVLYDKMVASEEMEKQVVLNSVAKKFDNSDLDRIIDVPTRACPEGERRDFQGNCRPYFREHKKSIK